VYDPLIAVLEGGPRSLREIAGEPALAKIAVNRLIQAITMLAAAGVCHPCLPAQSLAERKLRTDRFNRTVAEHARFERKFGSFASPVTGGGIAAERMHQLMWLGLQDNEADPGRFAAKALAQAGQSLLKDGKPLPADETLAELQRRFAGFEQETLGVWNALGLGAASPRKVADAAA